MFTAAFTKIKRWKQSKCLFTDRQGGKKNTKEYYSVLKRKKILTYATKWLQLEDIMLNQSQIDKYCDSTYMWYQN